MPTEEGYAAAASLVNVYNQWVPKERIITMNLWSSELCKLAANAMLAQRISSVNALSAICEVTGADVDEVSYACGLDSRIGPQMLKAGPGFGGRSAHPQCPCFRNRWCSLPYSCFQKDIFNIVYLSESLNLKEVADYWRAITNMNEHQKDRFTKRIISCLFNNLTNKRIAVLGFAFKKDTSDTRESPAIALVSNFISEQAKVAIYDPKVREEQIWKELEDYGGDISLLRVNVEICSDPYTACQGADAVVVVTEWDEFGNKTQASEDVVLTEVSPNRLQVAEKSKNRARPRETAEPTSLKPETKENLKGGSTSSVRSLDIDTKLDSQSQGRLDWGRIAESMRRPRYVFDGRNMLDHKKLEALGLRVEAIGKASRTGRGSLLGDQ